MKSVFKCLAVILLIALIFCVGDANFIVKSEEYAVQPPETEGYMALKDKLVNLEDLKVVGDAVGSLKSAVASGVLVPERMTGMYITSTGVMNHGDTQTTFRYEIKPEVYRLKFKTYGSRRYGFYDTEATHGTALSYFTAISSSAPNEDVIIDNQGYGYKYLYVYGTADGSFDAELTEEYETELHEVDIRSDEWSMGLIGTGDRLGELIDSDSRCRSPYYYIGNFDYYVFAESKVANGACRLSVIEYDENMLPINGVFGMQGRFRTSQDARYIRLVGRNIENTSFTSDDIDDVVSDVHLRIDCPDYERIIKPYMCGTGCGLNFIEALKELENYDSDKVLYVQSGTYDIFTQLGGTAYLATITSESTAYNIGLPALKKGKTRIVGVGNVVLNYMPELNTISSYPYAANLISVLNIYGNAEIENITINARYCRYCVHDETQGLDEYKGTVKSYKNCVFTHYAKLSSSQIGGATIGGGCDNSQTITIENCRIVNENGANAVSWHNRNGIGGCVFNFVGTEFVTSGNNALRFGNVLKRPMNFVYIVSCYLNKPIYLNPESGDSNSWVSFQLYISNSSDVDVIIDNRLETNNAEPIIKNAVAYFDDTYENLTSGNAEQLLSTTGVTDKAPYLLRPSAGDGADREMDMLIGGTVAWNQINKNGNMDGTTNIGLNKGTATASDNILTLTATQSATGVGINFVSGLPYKANHKILMQIDIKTALTNLAVKASISGAETGVPSKSVATNAWTTLGWINTYTIDSANLYMYVLSYSSVASGSTIQYRNAICVDLTQMFGSTIADYVYSLESATAGAGIALLKSWGYFTKPYYAYDAGELLSVNTSAHEMVGFNQWDEEILHNYTISSTTGEAGAYTGSNCTKNFIPLVNDATYYLKAGVYQNARWYDGNKNYLGYSVITANATFVPKNVFPTAAYLKFNITGAYSPGDICINLSCARNGEYQPYVKRTYALDSDLTLRGIPKLDSNNGLYYDGDTYEADGTVTRRYGSVDLGTLEWVNYKTGGFNAFIENAKAAGQNTPPNVFIIGYIQKGSSVTLDSGMMTITGGKVYIVDSNFTTDAAAFKTAMSGVYLVYELATPTTETADPYQTPQILDPNGTEAYIDSRDVPIPVGHETFYPENLRSKIEGLPTNFSTLIAPTEQTYTATQAYSSGALFIVQNILYKATASIANGATITPGTNCTATTLAAVIAALA